MVIIEFGAAEKQTLDSNSLFLRFTGPDFKVNVDKIKKYWNRTYLAKTKEWEVPFSCWDEIKQLYADSYIQYLNNPPKAKFVTDDDILNGLDFNGFKLYDYQLDGVRFGLNHHNFLLLDEQGLGKAQPLDTTVYTPSGKNCIGNLKLGDYVLGYNGRTKVVGVFDRGILPTYEITFDDGTKTVCSNDHLWTVKNSKYTSQYYVVDTNYIMENFENMHFYIPMVKCSDFDEKQLDTDPYEFGKNLSKHHYNHNKLKDCICDVLFVKSSYDFDGNLFIPDKYKYNSYENRLRLLQGILDENSKVTLLGDVVYKSKSVSLLQDVKELCETFGAKVKFIYRKFFSKDIPTGIKIAFPTNIICYSNRKNLTLSSIIKMQNKHNNRKITQIRYLGNQYCRCIKVEADDGLYLTDDLIVTHNTLQILTLARYKKQHRGLKHCLIICGINSLKYNWYKEVAKFCKDEKAVILGAKRNSKGRLVKSTIEETKQQIKDCPEEFFWIINIEKIRLSETDNNNHTGVVNYLNDHIESGNLGMVVCDEIHKVKNIKSQQSKGLMSFNPKADRIGMTGTLLVNNPYDLFCPMSFTGLINYNQWLFEKKFVIKDDWNRPIGYQNMGELHNILYKSSIRRTKDLLDLPEKIYTPLWIDFTEEEQELFDVITGNSCNTKLLDKVEPPTDVLAAITRMRQVCIATELVSSKVKVSSKFNRLNDILTEAKFNNRKVLVFCPYTEALKLGMEYCKQFKPKLVCGGMGDKIQQVVDEHENTDGFSVIFAQEATLGVGFTLTNTEICVFLSPPWSRATYDQCSDRIHRIGQKKTVQVIDLLINNTYDELVYSKIHGKGAMSDVLIDGKPVECFVQQFADMGIQFQNEQSMEAIDLIKLLSK